MKQTIKITSPPSFQQQEQKRIDSRQMVSVFYAVDGRSVVIIGRGGHPCVALICSVARQRKKTNEVNRSERRYTVNSVQCFSSKHWAVCPLLLAQPVDFRLSLISNQLKSFEFLRLNTSKFFGLGSWRRSRKSLTQADNK